MLPSATALEDAGADSPDYLSEISDIVDDLSSGLRKLSLDVHDHPELQYKEYHAHKVITKYLKDQSGWTVTPSAYGIETAFVAVYDSGKEGAVVSFNVEYGTLLPLVVLPDKYLT